MSMRRRGHKQTGKIATPLSVLWICPFLLVGHICICEHNQVASIIMSVSVFDLINTVSTIYKACEDVSSSKKVVRVAGEKLQAMIPLLQTLEAEDKSASSCASDDFVKGLHKELQALQKLIDKAGRMSSVLYVIKAASIHDDIETALRRLHFSFGALSVRQNIGLRNQLRAFQESWRKREGELSELRIKEKEGRRKLLQGQSEQEIMLNLMNATDTGTEDDLLKALAETKLEQEELDHILNEAISANDSVRQSKIQLEQEYLQQIIEALAWGEKHLQKQEVNEQQLGPPIWALCPITFQVMKDPVIVDSLCLHSCEREVLEVWLRRGHMTCPGVICNFGRVESPPIRLSVMQFKTIANALAQRRGLPFR